MRINKGTLYKVIVHHQINDEENEISISYDNEKFKLIKWYTGEISEFIAPLQDVYMYGGDLLKHIVKHFNAMLND